MRRCLLCLSLLALVAPARGEVTAVVFSRDGKTLYAAGTGMPIRILDGTTGKVVRSIDPDQEVFGLALSPDGKRLAAAGEKGILVLELPGGKKLRTLKGHTGVVAAVAFSPDGKVLASAGYDGSIRLWGEDGKPIRTLRGHDARVTSVCFAPDGKTLVSGGVAPVDLIGIRGLSQADTLILWDVPTGEKKQRLGARGQNVTFTPDGSALVAAGTYVATPPAQGGGVSLNGGARALTWDLERNRERHRFEENGTALAVSPDGRLVAVGRGSHVHSGGVVVTRGGGDPSIRVWEVASGGEVMRARVLHDVTALTFSPDGTRLACGRKSPGSEPVELISIAPDDWAANKDLSVTDVENAWETLVGADASAAYRAVWTLAAADRTLAFLKDHLKPAAPAGATARKLIADLDSRSFKVRESAQKELGKLGAQVEPELREALKGEASAEVRSKISQLLEQIAAQEIPLERMREDRAVAILERIGTPEARALLKVLSQGAPSAYLTRRAKTALERR